MKKIKITLIVLLTVIQLSSLGNVIAQEVPIENSTPVIEESTDAIPVVDDLVTSTIITDQGVDLQTSSDIPPIQDTFNSQDGSGADVLITDAEVAPPEDIPADNYITTTPSDVLIDDTETVAPATETIEEEAPLIEEPIMNIEEPNITYRQTIQLVELKPKSIYTFSFTQNRIKTEKVSTNINKDDFLKSKSVDNTINPVVDSETGGMSFGGICNTKYFVVLLYKNESDYINNSNSYIINKAFECVGGRFSYTIDQLPNNLSDGKYYLLIGQQGDTGSWTPISSLTEIVIGKNVSKFENVIVNEEIITPAPEPTVEPNPAPEPIPGPISILSEII